MPETELLLPIPTPLRAVIVLPEPTATAFAAPALALLPTAVALSSCWQSTAILLTYRRTKMTHAYFPADMPTEP